MSAEEESGDVFVRKGLRIRREIIRPILEEVARNFKSSWPSAETAVVELPGSAIGLVLRLEGERRQLTFSFDVTPRKVRVSHTDARDNELPMGKPVSLSEMRKDRVQSYVDDFLAAVTPK